MCKTFRRCLVEKMHSLYIVCFFYVYIYVYYIFYQANLSVKRFFIRPYLKHIHELSLRASHRPNILDCI